MSLSSGICSKIVGGDGDDRDEDDSDTDSKSGHKAAVTNSPNLLEFQTLSSRMSLSSGICSDSSTASISSHKAAVTNSSNSEENFTEENSDQVTTMKFVPEGLKKNFEKVSVLGKGGFGFVWKARNIIDKTFYAVKRVKFNKKASREVAALAKLEHKNIVRYFTSWISEELQEIPMSLSASSSSSSSDPSIPQKYLYIQMKYCEKGTLKNWIKKQCNNSEMKVLHMFMQIIAGVGYIHSMNLIHRDLKPTNIFLDKDETAKIGDFGLTTSKSAENTVRFKKRTTQIGTVPYMSPEQMNQQKYENEVDIYALGIIFFEMLWPTSTKAERCKIVSEVKNGKFPEQFCEQYFQETLIIRLMLSEDPKRRPTADCVAERVEEIIRSHDQISKSV